MIMAAALTSDPPPGFSYMQTPKNKIEKNHNKQALALLETKKPANHQAASSW